MLVVPTLQHNLISLSNADEACRTGMSYSGGKQKIILRSQTRQLLLDKLNNGLYEVQAAPVLSGADPAIKTSLVSQADHTVLWHRRFGHAGHSTLAKMSRTNTVQGLPSPQVFKRQLLSTQVCTPCAEGKMKRESFHSSPNRASTKIEKLHVDLAGLF